RTCRMEFGDIARHRRGLQFWPADAPPSRRPLCAGARVCQSSARTVGQLGGGRRHRRPGERPLSRSREAAFPQSHRQAFFGAWAAHRPPLAAGPSGDRAGETAEVTFTVQQDLAAGRAFYADIKRRAAAYGRPPHAIKVLPGVMTVIGHTRSEAADKCERLQALLSPELAIKDLSSYFGIDLTAYPLDGPVPDPSPAIEQ